MTRQRPHLHGDRPDVGELPIREDVDRELRSHLEMRAAELIQEGWEPGAARAEAERLFGDIEKARRASESETRSRDRALRRAYRWEAVMQDVKYAIRSLKRSPGFATVAVITLALGIGANSAIFSVLNGVLLKPLPYPAPNEIVWIHEAHDGPGAGPGPVPWTNFVDWQAQTSTLAAMAAFGGGSSPVVGGDQPVNVSAASVSRDFWGVFPIRPVMGRLTTPDDHVEGANGVALLSERFWRSQFGGDPSIVGSSLEVGGRTVEVIGILPLGFNFPYDADVWDTVERFPRATSRTAHNWRVVARLAPGSSIGQADADLDRISVRMVEGLAEDDYDLEGAIVVPLREEIAGDSRRPLFLLMGAALMVLLIAATNLASTLLARGANRGRELAVRASLGAARGRLIRQLLTENLVLSILGAGAGLVLAFFLIGVLRQVGSTVPRINEVGIDPAVILFTLAAAAATTIISGLLPAFRLSEGGLASRLRSGTRGSTSARGLIWRVLIGAEVALALVLLSGGGLLIRSFQQIMAVDPGFEAEGLFTVSSQLSAERYPTLPDYSAWYQQLMVQLERRPELAGAAVTTVFPLQGGYGTGRVNLDNNPEDYVVGGAYVAISPKYFDVMGIPLVRGRVFTNDDSGPEGMHVVIVSESFAEDAWPGEDPIGKVMTSGGMDNYWEDTRWAQVIGVVGDVRYAALTGDVQPAYYFPIYQRPFRSRFAFHVVGRGVAGMGDAVSAVREEISRLDGTIPLEVTSIDERVAGSLAERRFILLILGGFAGLALILASIGIYGVISYNVASRSREMGIRLALGETPGSVRGSVLKTSFMMVAGGLIVGGAGAIGGGRVVQSFLWGVEAGDPLTIAAVIVVLIAAALLAAWIPAMRATRVDPITAMRAE